MLRAEWGRHIDITSYEDVYSMVKEYLDNKDNIICGGFDTEGSGLHIIHDHMFLFQFGWVTSDMKGVTYAVDIEQYPKVAEYTIIQWNALATTLPIYLGHNVGFDLHMLINYGHPYAGTNVSDTMSWIRLSCPAIPERKGGPPLGLKNFSKQFLSTQAKNMEQKLKEERTKIASDFNEKLKRKLKWRKKDIDEFFNDKVHDIEDLPDDKRNAYYEWYDDLPDWIKGRFHGSVDSDDIPYFILNRQTCTYYAHLDIVWTCETYLRCRQVVENHGNMDAMEIENTLIPILVEMERQGLDVDLDYLETSRKRMKEYIVQRREDLNRLAGEPLKCTQSLKIKELCATKFGHPVETTASEELGNMISDIKKDYPDDPIIEFLDTIAELRTLEKWYATYILRFLKEIDPNERKIFTRFNASGTVSGRFTSDLQQFPKEGIVSRDGVELFSPRKMVLVPDGGDTRCLVYLDYSALELRIQAMYTLLVAGGDKGLCRAYEPFECHSEDGINFDPFNREHVAAAYTQRWYENDSNEEWKPTDVHGLTTKIAFGIDESHPDFHALRYKGKRVNFCKNYGGGRQQIRRMFPEYDEETITRIDESYYKAFPGVEQYHKWVYATARSSAYMENLFGVRYWGASGFNLINMLVQGSGAYLLKLKLIQLNKYIKENNLKSRIVLTIHDEVVFKIATGEEEHVWQFKKILQTWDDAPVPMVSDCEATSTRWIDKQEFGTEEEFLQWIQESR